MANFNPGPAITANPNTILETAPVNTLTSSTPMGTNAFRLLGSARAVNLAATGDTLIPIINASSYSVFQVIVTNAQLAGVSGSIATSQCGLFTAAAAGGTAIVAAAANASNTTAPVVNQRTVASTAAVAGQNLFLNVNVALATATCDVFVYGFDLS